MSKNANTNGLMNAQDALVAIMVAGGASDENISNRELVSISRIVDHLPIFKSYDPSKIKIIAETEYMKYFKPPRLFNQVKVFDPNVNSTVVRSKIVTFLIFSCK